MVELLARFGAGDAALLDRVLGVGRRGHGSSRPTRVVVDAHIAGSHPEIAASARLAGTPLLIDPQTHFLQDVQHPADPWAGLPFAAMEAHTPSDLHSPARLDQLVATCVEYQLAHGATAVIAPYTQIERADSGWIEVQVALWRHTRRYLSHHDVQIPVIAVLAVGWRLLHRPTWVHGLDRLLAGVVALQAGEIALAASKIDRGARPDERLADLVATIRHCRRVAPVIAWQQGVLGEAAVAAGAIGYETGIGWRERCDLGQSTASHRHPADAGPRAARPVYVEALRRSIPKASLRVLLAERRLSPDLLCMDVTCCPGGRESLLGDARAHALTARVRGLAELDAISRSAWRWTHMAQVSATGLQLADRINTLAGHTPQVTRVDTHALRAIHTIADHRRQTRGRRAA